MSSKNTKKAIQTAVKQSDVKLSWLFFPKLNDENNTQHFDKNGKEVFYHEIPVETLKLGGFTQGRFREAEALYKIYLKTEGKEGAPLGTSEIYKNRVLTNIMSGNYDVYLKSDHITLNVPLNIVNKTVKGFDSTNLANYLLKYAALIFTGDEKHTVINHPLWKEIERKVWKEAADEKPVENITGVENKEILAQGKFYDKVAKIIAKSKVSKTVIGKANEKIRSNPELMLLLEADAAAKKLAAATKKTLLINN